MKDDAANKPKDTGSTFHNSIHRKLFTSHVGLNLKVLH